MGNNDIYKKLRDEHFEMLHQYLSAKELVLDELYNLAEYMDDDGDCRDLWCVETVAKAIDFIKNSMPEGSED